MDRPFKPKYCTVSQVLLQLVVASLIMRAIEEFKFRRSQLKGRENSIFRTF